jgi:hypothetical protein
MPSTTLRAGFAGAAARHHGLHLRAAPFRSPGRGEEMVLQPNKEMPVSNKDRVDTGSDPQIYVSRYLVRIAVA